MKIILVNGRGYPEYGCENYFTNLSLLLKREGHEVIPFTTKDERNTDKQYSAYCVSKINVDELGSIPPGKKLLYIPKVIYSLESRRKMERLIRDTRPDLVHLHNIKRLISPSILGPIKKAGIPVVQTLHDYHLCCPNYRLFVGGRPCEECRGKKYYRAFFKRCIRGSFPLSLLASFEQYLHGALGAFEKNIDLFIAPTRFLRQKMIDSGLGPKKVSYVPNFIFTQDYQPSFTHEGYIVCTGRLVREKGADILIRAMRDIPELKLLILGGGEYRRELEAAARDGNIKNVEFKGYLPHKEVKAIIQKAAFTVVPSRWYEVCPLVILESFAMAKPVIGAAIGGIPELIEDGVNGLLFKPGDPGDLSAKIRLLLSDPGRLKQMGEAARQRALESYDSGLHYQRLSKIYRSLS